MSNILRLLLLVIILSSGCQSEDDFNIAPTSELQVLDGPIYPFPEKPHLLSALVIESNCARDAKSYTLYASSGTKHTVYDRHVYVGIISNNNIVEAKLLKIPALQTKSNNVAVFDTPVGVLNTVKVKIYGVYKNGVVDIKSDYNLLETTMSSVNYCLEYSGSSSPCNGIIDLNESPSETDDDDGDGLCNGSDPDRDGNGIPDIME
ncbi:hypothetical protein GCM10011506_06410 [Marivirga lumbricoides]|uniref:Lipoprotein n=1 Tax=Marivirga lumbricoides TaxID=1046115 RepID=A0ABQ1LKD6_9BACT|nr:hypothetical protein GCM10011506_06410 [Marivirga lumbricoides]